MRTTAIGTALAFVSVPDSVRTAIVDYVFKAFFDELMRS